MIIENYNYNDYIIEIHENPIYHDFEFVVKSFDGSIIEGTSLHPYLQKCDAEMAAKILISEI